MQTFTKKKTKIVEIRYKKRAEALTSALRDSAGARTLDPILKRDVLYLLSYWISSEFACRNKFALRIGATAIPPLYLGLTKSSVICAMRMFIKRSLDAYFLTKASAKVLLFFDMTKFFGKKVLKYANFIA